MDDDNTTRRKEQQRKALIEEENHYNALKRVFGSEEGTSILEWVLTELCGYWRGGLSSDREIGKFELGRTLFNQVCMADIAIVHNILDRRRKQAEAVRNAERKRIETKNDH